jgi:hypothetical protein
MLQPLPPAPPELADEAGAPRMGLYAGALGSARWSSLREPYAPGLLEKRLIEKRWTYAWVGTDEVMAAMAIVDAGYLSSGFCAVFDRGSRRLLVDENPVLPPLCARVSEDPAAGLSARLFGPGIRAAVERAGEKISLKAAWGAAAIELSLDAERAPTPMTAIAPVGSSGRFDLTQKTVLIPAQGEIRAGNSRFPIRGAFAGLDHTHGFLARDTSWRWAFGMGRQKERLVAFNLSEGFLQGEGENAAWIDGEPRAVGPVRFTFTGSDPAAPWQIRSPDGALDLTFSPEGQRAQTVDLKVIVSRYVQPFGTFSGRIDGVEISALPGVTEDHTARW